MCAQVHIEVEHIGVSWQITNTEFLGKFSKHFVNVNNFMFFNLNKKRQVKKKFYTTLILLASKAAIIIEQKLTDNV